jgi:hypothetical protein
MIPQVKTTYGMSLVNQCWNINLKPAVLRTLVESMPGRVKAILKSKGGLAVPQQTLPA